MGIKKGDVITIVSENRLNYIVPVLAALYSGIAANLLNPDYTTGELKQAVLISKPKLIFCSEKYLENVYQVKWELKLAEAVILMNYSSKDTDNAKSLNTLLGSVCTDINSFEPETFNCCDQIALILMSSGTTGLPKGALLTHQNLRTPECYMRHPKFGGITPHDTVVHYLPLFHMYGLMVQLSAISCSMKVVIMEKYAPDLYLQCIQDYKATKLFIVPSTLYFFAKTQLVSNYDVSSVTDVICGGAPVGIEIQNEVKKRLRSAAIRQVYGLTELCGIATCQVSGDEMGPVGTLVPECLAKVVNTDTSESLGALEKGELRFKGPMVMKGYVGIPRQSYLDEDGFICSGDIGFYDENERFYVVDRIKELIKYKAYQVPPAELEALIMSHPSVRECGVIGVPDEKSGELPLAFVVPQDGADITEQDILDFVSERISVQKRLYGGVKFIDQIPKTSTGKILRRELLKIFETS